MNLVIQSLWFLLPAGAANLIPPLVKKINLFNQPISTRLFGDHKTYRGFFFGILAAITTAWLQKTINLSTHSILNYDQYILIGTLLGTGALIGDLIKSYFKRKIKIKPGGTWLFFDQTDWIIGSIIFSLPLGIFSYQLYLVALANYTLIHVATNQLGYLLRINEKPI